MANVSQSSICGIGIGAENCYVAVARQGGIEIILNEYSQYSTPAYIGFGSNQRDLGTSAKQKQMTHLRSTCFAPSLLLGKKFSELDLKSIPFAVEEGPDDSILIRVEHAGDELVLTPTQVLAMMFTKLRHIGGNPVDCVINCPNYFTDVQRRQLINAAKIAGLNPLKLINDTTSVALFYGFYRNHVGRDFSILCFLDCGQSSTQSSIFLFNHKENTLQALDTQYEANIGGRDFDQLIANHFIETQKLELNNRARYRLYAECEKLKKQMSANSNELPVSVECLYDDRDFSGRMDRAKFLELAEPLFAKIKAMLELNLQVARDKFNKDYAETLGEFHVDSIEIFGGSSRIPAIKQIVKSVFGIDASTTLNADEAVARGCALQCAILSPNFKISKALNIHDSMCYQVNFGFDATGDNEEYKWVKFLRGTTYPVTKKITGMCKKFPINVRVEYVDNDGAAKKSSEYVITEPEGKELSSYLETNQVVFRLRFDLNGNVFLQSASLNYEKPLNSDVEMDGENGVEKMEVDEASAEKKKKPKLITVDLAVQVLSCVGGLSPEELNKCIETEANLVLADKNWKEKTDAKNALEEFIYEWRDKLSSLEVYVAPEEKEAFQKELESNESWLYEQEDQDIMHSKSVYDERTNKMREEFANKILNRKYEFEQNPSVLERLGYLLQQTSKFVDTAGEDEKENIEKLQKEIQEKQEYFDSVQGKIKNWNPSHDAPVTCEEIRQNTNALQTSLNMAQNARKRLQEQRKKAEDEAAAAANGSKTSEEQTADSGEAKEDAAPAADDDAAAGDKANMEVD